MTVSTTSSSTTAEGNGVTTSFTYGFIMPSTSDAVVTLLDTTVSPAVVTVIPNSQYGITGVGVATGGTVLYPLSGPALVSGQYLTIARVLPFQQLVSIANQGDFYPFALEQMGDLLEMQIQQLNNSVLRTIRMNPADPGTVNPLPPFSVIAGQLLGFDSTGQPIAAQPSSALVSVAMQPVVNASTVQAALALMTVGNPSIVIPTNIGQPYAQTVVGDFNGAAASATAWESMLSVQMTSNVGFGGGNAFKVGAYIAVQADPGSGPVWALNALVLVSPGALTTGLGQIVELDLANNSLPFGVGIGVSGLAPPALIGMQISGDGLFTASCAIAILGTVSGPLGLWNAGIVFANNSVNEVSILDENSSNLGGHLDSYIMLGSKRYGIDTHLASFSAGPMLIGNTQAILSRNNAGNANLSLIAANASDQVVLGNGTSKVIVAAGTGANQAVNFSQFPATAAAVGTYTLPNGVIVKWGTGSTTSGVGAVTFAAAFPTACNNATVTIAGGTTATTLNALLSGTLTASGFPVYGAAAQSVSFFWQAIGH